MAEKKTEDCSSDELNESEFEKKFEDAVESFGEEITENVEKYLPKFLEPLLGALLMIGFMVFVNLFWDRFSFITDDFEKILPFYNLSLLIGIVINISKIFIKSYTYKILTDIVNTIFFIFVAMLVWEVYPFNVPEEWDFIIRILIILPPIAATFGTLVEIGKFIMNGGKKPEQQK